MPGVGVASVLLTASDAAEKVLVHSPWRTCAQRPQGRRPEGNGRALG